MQTSATIISLVGQAWARDANGALRALKVGDRLENGETLVSAAGSRIDLQFDQGQIVTVLGEHEVALDELLPAAAPGQPQTEAAQETAAAGEAAPDIPASQPDQEGQSEGHGFVQLVRLDETIEADGLTPLNVSRIVERIEPWSMSLDNTADTLPRRLEHVGRDEHAPREHSVIATPKSSISIDVIAGDDIINAAEAAGDVTVSGTVGQDVKAGDTVTITVNGKTYTTTVNADGKTWQVDVPGAELVADNSVHASVTTSNAAGNKSSAETERPYEIQIGQPTANPIAPISSADGLPFTLDAGNNFNDPDGDPLTFSATNLPDGLSIDPDTGKISGTLDRSASQGGTNNDGVYTVVITATDPAGNTVSETVELTITNPPPVALNDLGVTDEDTPLHVDASNGVLANDSDPDGDPITVSAINGDTAKVGTQVAGSSGGLFTIHPDGSYSFDPNGEFDSLAAGEVHITTIEYTISDGEGGFDTATLAVRVHGVNNPPTPVDSIDDQANDDATTITLIQAADFFDDIDHNDVLTYSATGLPTGLSIDPDTGEISGTLDSSASQHAWQGVYNVTVTATDLQGASASQSFTWTVSNPAPQAQDDFGSTDEDQILTVDAADGVLSNDIDEDELTVTPISKVLGSHGGLFTLHADGSYEFNPNGDFDDLAQGESRETSYTYTVTDADGATDTATLTITVNGVNNAPTAVGTIADQTNDDGNTISGLDVSGYFDDIDASDELEYSASGLPAGLSIDPVTGIISGQLDSSASQGGQNGVHTVTITATDPHGASTTQTFDWTVHNPAPVAQDDANTTDENTALQADKTDGVLANDDDPDGDDLVVAEVNGDAAKVGTQVAGSHGGLFTLHADGSYSFDPNGEYDSLAAGDSTTTSITYTVSDGEGGTDTATLTITVNGVNNAPTAVNTIADQTSNDADTISGLVVAGYFRDVDSGDVLTYSATGLPEGLSIDADTGLISGTIHRSASQDGQNGEHRVTIAATDSQGATAEQTFTWTVNNPTPIAKDDTATTYEDTPLHIDATNGVLANDHDPDGDPLSVTSFEINGTTYNAGDTATIAGIGELTLKSDGSYDFIPEDDWNGTVPTITYTIDDGEGGTATATLTITVEPVVDITLSADPQIDEGDQITLTASVENPVQDKPLHVILDNGQTITIAVGETEGSIQVDSRPDDAYIQDTTTASFKVISASGGSEHINDSSFGSEVTVEIVDNADATSVALTASPDLTEAGGDLTYTLTLGNEVRAGDDPVEVSFKDLNGDTQTIEITSGTTGSVTVTIPSDLYEDVYKEDPQDVVIATDVSVTGGADFEALDTVTVGTIEITDTIDPVYARIEVDHDAVLEGGELTYTITLVDESGNAVKVADGKEVTIELGWSGAAANLDDVDQLPDSMTIPGGSDSANFTVKTKEDQIVELSEPLTVNITGVVDNDGTNIGFEDLRVDTNNNHATSHVLDAPTIEVLDDNQAADGQITVHERGLNTGDGSDVIDGVLRIAAPSGLEKISIAGTELTLAQLENLGTTNQTITIAGHGTITLTKSTMVETANGKPAVWEVDFTYTLTDPQTHTTQGADEALKDIDLGVTASNPVSGAQVNGTGTLGVLVIDDVPTVKLTGIKLDEAIVEEAHISGAKGTATVDFSNAFDIDHGADGNAGTAYELVINNSATGLTDTATGDDVLLVDNNGTIEGRTANSNELVFTIAVDADGKVTLTQLRALHHDDPLTPNDKVNIANGAIYLKATATDGDGDTASAEVNIGDRFVLQDDGPTVADLTDGVTLDEKYLPSGSAPDTDKTISATMRFKDIDFGADGFGDVRFSDETLSRLEEKQFKSNQTELGYVLSQDGHTLTAYRGSGRTESDKIFTAEIVDLSDNPGYQLTLHGPLDHLNQDGDSLTSLDLPFENILIIDGDGDTAVTRFNVKILDDKPSTEPRKIILDEDTDKTFNANADATKDNTIVTDSPTFGTATVNSDGTITYEPNPNYSGSDSFTYTTTINDVVKTFEVDVTVNPVADKPNLGHANETDDHVSAVTIQTYEDKSKKLGLKLPVIMDAVQHQDATDEDYPERLGAITLTPGGAGFIDDAKLVTGSKELNPVDGKITIVITDTAGSDTPRSEYHTNDVPTKNETGGVYYLTQAEYEAITAHPAEDRHENFEVKVEVTSYEVDEDGKPLAGIDGATSEQTITVDVLAVTDDVQLKLVEDTTQSGVTVSIENDGDKATVTFDEDTSFNLTTLLKAGHPDLDGKFKDTDGSEQRNLTIENLPQGWIVKVGETTHTIGNDGKITIDDLPQTGGLPEITIQPPKDVSGDLNGIKITLTAQDTDSDSSVTIAPKSDSVTLDLRVKPVAGDIEIKGVEGDEDTAIAFLKNVEVTDTSDVENTLGEVITEVRFKLPDGWTTNDSGQTWTKDGQTWTLTEPSTLPSDVNTAFEGGDYIIRFNHDSVLTRTEREDLLKEFKFTPPAHSSKDIELDIKVTSVDHSAHSGGSSSDSVQVDGKLKITVKPVAEKVDTDTDGDNILDLTINDNHVFTTRGIEDELFDLGTETGFRLSEGWSNQDGKWVDDGNGNWSDDLTGGRSEDTFALLTPYKTKNNDARANADLDGKLEGSVFIYTDSDNKEHTLPFAGEPVRIPMQYLDSVQFKAPKDWAGVVKVKVEAHTIDYDEDDSNITSEATSGEAWLTNLIVEPRADQVTLRVDGIVKTLEDEPVALRIDPTSSDPNETFNITIEGIPRGASIKYWEDGVEKTFTATADNSTLTIENFDKTKQPELTPPKDSNETISLNVTAESVDTLEYIDKNGDPQTIPHTDPDKTHTLPITVEVQGVPDEPSIAIVDGRLYVEDDDDQTSSEPLKVSLGDLITKLESGEIGVGGTEQDPEPDDSETVTLRISDLPEGFSLEGAGPTLGSGSGTERVWVISAGDLENVTIVAPQHFSGTVTFTAQPVVTENDNPSAVFFDKENITFKVTPVPEASLSISSDLEEDEIGRLNLEPVLAGDVDEYISAVRIKVDDTPEGVVFYKDAEGTEKIDPDGDYYHFTAPLVVYVKGPANFSGDKEIIVEYKVTDPSPDSEDMQERVEDVTSDWQEITHTLHFKPVTDKIEVSLGDITGDKVTTTNDTTELEGDGTVTVELKIDQVADENANNQKDTDGSEQLTHILITGVPEGVSVNGAVETAKGQWLMNVSNAFFNDPSGQLTQNLEFVVSEHAAAFDGQDIHIAAYSKDTGADAYEKASLDWTLTHTRTGEPGEGDLPDEVTLEAKNYQGTEDEEFSLADVVTGTISNDPSGDYNITVTIRTSPEDETSFSNMTPTQVVEDGKPVILWTATVAVSSSENGQSKLDNLLENIKVTPPKDANSNNLADGALKLDINLAAHADGLSKNAGATPEVDIRPVTDEFTVAVSSNSVDEGEDIPLTISLPADHVDGELGTDWTIVDDLVYIHIADNGLEGVLVDADDVLLEALVGERPKGTPTGGTLYAVDKDALSGLKFVPDKTNHPHQTGSLDVTVLVKHQEADAENIKTSTGTGSLAIHPSNSGYEADITAEGDEFQGLENANELIKLELGSEAGLVDNNETIHSAFISGLPSGFTVWTGDSTNPKMANNAGENTWAIPLNNDGLPTIFIKPPKNWSGTLEDLTLTVMSGHTGLPPRADEIDFNLVINPVADGLTMEPTLSFGDAGDRIALNLNATMKDPKEATGADGDQHTERTTLKLSGFPDGQKVLFFIGDSEEPLGESQATFTNGTWTLTGLTQEDLNKLNFLHAETSGDKTISVKAWTYEVDTEGNPVDGVVSDPVERTDVKINITPTIPTSGDDHFLWEQGKLIDGFGGEDTVQLRYGDDLGETDFKLLKNIEIIDMQGSGKNEIIGLSIEDVLEMTDNRNELKILGDSEDSIELVGSWIEAEKGDYVTYTGTFEGNNVTLQIHDSIQTEIIIDG